MSEPETATSFNIGEVKTFRIDTGQSNITMASGYAQQLAMAHEIRRKQKLTDTVKLFIQDEVIVQQLVAALLGIIATD